MPLPLVTDVDGDGKNEVVVLADGGTEVRVLSVPAASGETLVRERGSVNSSWVVRPVLTYNTRFRPF